MAFLTNSIFTYLVIPEITSTSTSTLCSEI